MEQCLREGKQPESLQNKEDLEQIRALINIATTLVGIGFANSEAREKLGNNLDKPRLEKILAKTERHAQRNNIKKARIVFLNYLDSEYLLNLLQDFTNSHGVTCNYGKYKLSALSSLLAPMPNYKDAYFDEADDTINWRPKDDKTQVFLRKVLKGENNVGKVFIHPSTLDKFESEVNYLKFVGMFNSILDIAKELPEKGPAILDDVVRVVNQVKLKMKDVALEGTIEVEKLSTKFSKSANPLSEAGRLMLGINEKSVKMFNDNFLHKLVVPESWTEVNQISLTKKFEKAILNNPKLKKLAEFKSGMPWSNVIRGVSGLNLFFAGAAFRNWKKANKGEKYLAAFKFLNASGDFWVAHRNIQQISMSAKGIDIDIIKAFERQTKLIGKGVQYLGVIIDTAEAGRNFWERDYDAAAAYGGSALLTGLSIFASATPNFWNPIGWGLGIAAIGLGFYAAFLEDDAIERYAKNSVFGDIPYSNKLTKLINFPVLSFSGSYLEYIKQHISIENREKLLKAGFENWSDYRKGFKDLMDVVYSGRIILQISTIDSVNHHNVPRFTYPQHTEIRSKITSIKCEFMFGSEILEESQLEYYLYYCPKGVGGGTYHLLPNDSLDIKIVVSNKNEIGTAKFSFSIPSNFHLLKEKDGAIVVMGRLNLNENLSFPFKIAGEDRYIAGNLKTFYTTELEESVKSESYNFCKVDTIQNILNGDK